jgi:hypothetical protein
MDLVESGLARTYFLSYNLSLSPLVALRMRAPDSTPEQLTGTTVLSAEAVRPGEGEEMYIVKTLEGLLRNTITTPSGCMEWQGGKDSNGYGRLKHEGKTVSLTRFVLKLDGRSVPSGYVACHKCDNPPCINPDHLFVGTPKDNVRDAARKGHMVFGFWGNNKNRATKRLLGQRNLEHRNQEIVRLRLDGRTWPEIADKYGLSVTRVKQIYTQDGAA